MRQAQQETLDSVFEEAPQKRISGKKLLHDLLQEKERMERIGDLDRRLGRNPEQISPDDVLRSYAAALQEQGYSLGKEQSVLEDFLDRYQAWEEGYAARRDRLVQCLREDAALSRYRDMTPYSAGCLAGVVMPLFTWLVQEAQLAQGFSFPEGIWYAVWPVSAAAITWPLGRYAARRVGLGLRAARDQRAIRRIALDELGK